MADKIDTLNTKKDLLSTYVAVGLTVLVCCVNMVDVKMSLVLVIGLIVIFVMHLKPPYALAILIFLAPFSGTELINKNLAGIPGLKIMNMVLLAVVMAFILSKRHFKAKGPEVVFILGSIALLTTSTIRSVPHLPILNLYYDVPMGSGKYIASHLIKPIFFLLTFLIISGYMRDERDVNFTISCFKFSMLLLSLFIFVFYIIDVPDKNNFEHVRRSFINLFKTHTNSLSDFYIIGYPIVLGMFLYKRNFINFMNVFFSLSCVAILYSRTAYILIVYSTLLFLVLEKKKKLLPLVVLLGICAVLISPETVIDRGLMGIEERNLGTFSAGRVEGIWLPLLNEVKDDPKKLFVGSGRQAIIHSSPIWKGHAHNMYLTTLLDTGIVGLSFFVLFFTYFLNQIRKGVRNVPKGKFRTLLTGTLVSIIAYLVSGMTGRSFFPEMSNSYLWILLAVAMNITNMHHKERIPSHERP